MIVLKNKNNIEFLINGALKLFKSELEALGSLSLLPNVSYVNKQETEITSLAAADEVKNGGLTFATSPKFLKTALENKASVIIISSSLTEEISLSEYSSVLFVVSAEPRLLFTFILKFVSADFVSSFENGRVFYKNEASVEKGKNIIIGEGTYIGQNVKIGDNVEIYPHCYLDDDVEIGANTVIFPKVTLLWGVKIGRRCKIYTSAVIGSDGFGYNQLPDWENKRLRHIKNTHLGTVIIEDDVEIGANTCIDRGLVSNTIIKSGSKIDNLVQIGHNCLIENDCIIVSQVGIAGHVHIKNRAFLLGQAGLAPGAIVGEDAIITAQSGVTGTVPNGREAWMGSPARKANEEMAIKALSYRELPKLRSFFLALKKAASFEELKNKFFEKK